MRRWWEYSARALAVVDLSYYMVKINALGTAVPAWGGWVTEPTLLVSLTRTLRWFRTPPVPEESHHTLFQNMYKSPLPRQHTTPAPNPDSTVPLLAFHPIRSEG